MKYIRYVDFDKSLHKLYQESGSYRMAAEKVRNMAGDISLNRVADLSHYKLTNHGESRIKHCIKYSLNEGCRLITIVNNDITAFCFVGKHDDCEKWIKKNKGMILAVNKKDQIITTFESIDINNQGTRIYHTTDLSNGYLYHKLDSDTYDRICKNVPRSICKKFEELQSFSTDDDIFNLAEKIEDSKLANLFFDVFTLLCNSNTEEAYKRIKLHYQENLKVEDIDKELINDLVEGDLFVNFENFESELIDHLMNTATFYQWMLFLHPEQRKIVDRDFNGSSRLSGVSGSGKTCVVIKRAIRLAEKYKGEEILVLTLNKALVKLINDLMDIACTNKNRVNIRVMSFWELCREELRNFEPVDFERMITDITWKTNEDINEIWEEYYHLKVNNRDAEVFFPIIQSLIAQNVDPVKYIYEELDYIRSVYDTSNRKKYLDLVRDRRAIALDKDFREKILTGLEKWEDKMKFVGIIDNLGIANKLYSYIDKIVPKYRCVLIDESQDFGNIELEIVRKLVRENENDIFLSGDNAQQVYSKYHKPLNAGIDVRGKKSLKLNINYRNSKEILTAAYSILQKNLPAKEFLTEDFEVLDPKYSNFSTPKPLILKANNFDHELYFALDYSDKVVENRPLNKVCIVFAGLTLTETKGIGKIFNKKALDGFTDINDGSIFFSDLEQAKGFEFDSIIILNCNDDVLPFPKMPKQEWYRELTKLYVAMTRAKRELIISYSNNLSHFIRLEDENFKFGEWEEHATIHKNDIKQEHILKKKNVTDFREIEKLTGKQYLYTNNAIGLSKELQDKMIKLINGSERKDEKGRILEWMNLGEVIKSTRGDVINRFGVDANEFFDHFKYLYDKGIREL